LGRSRLAWDDGHTKAEPNDPECQGDRLSWDESEPTMRVPREPGDPEHTRILPSGHQSPFAPQPENPPGQPAPGQPHAAGQPGGSPYSPQSGAYPSGQPYPPASYPAGQHHPQQQFGQQQRPAHEPWRPVYPGQAWPTQQPSHSAHPQQGTPYQPEPPGRTGRLSLLAAGIALVVGLIAGSIAGVTVVALDRRDSSVDTPAIGNGPDPRVRPGSVADVAQRLLPSVVQLKVDGDEGSGTGSGFVIDTAGHILTNNHVVALAGDDGLIEVVTEKGSTATAKLVGKSPAYDLAVVKVDGLEAPAVQFGQSSKAVVGQDVVAIGSPLGLAGTVTSGIVSAKNRPVTAGGEGEISYINALQTDAAINPGNSGGPLVDMNGRVIGVNSAIATVSGQSESEQSGNIGLGFAIPIDQARRTAEQLIATGKASYPVIGANLDMRYEGGAKISEVNSGSPAQSAGVRADDVVTSIDGQKVTSAEALIVAIRTHRPGEVVKLSLERDGKSVNVTVTLGQQTG